MEVSVTQVPGVRRYLSVGVRKFLVGRQSAFSAANAFRFQRDSVVLKTT
jgi:hypothetical protein